MTSRPIPDHGTRACYLRGCRRTECVDAHKRYCKAYSIDRHRNGPRRVDAAPAIQHVQDLIARGCTRSGIVHATTVCHYTVIELAEGTATTLLPDTARKVLAFQPAHDHPAFGYWTDATGTVRRLRALASIGHPVYTVAQTLGAAPSTVRKVAAGDRAVVSKDFAAAVADLYPTWITRPGPSSIVQRHAQARGWHGPLAWDDIDNPDEQPDLTGVTTPQQLKRRAQPEVITAEVHHLARLGESTYAIARQLGRSEKRISQLMPQMGVAA